MLSSGAVVLRDLEGLSFSCVVLQQNPSTFVESYDIIYVGDRNVETAVSRSELTKLEAKSNSESSEQTLSLNPDSPDSEAVNELVSLGLSKLDKL